MKTAVLLFFALFLTAHNIFSQTLPKKPSRAEVGAYNQANLLKIDLGSTKSKVVEVMGGIQKIQTYVSTTPVTKKEDIVINNPIEREFKTDTSGNTVEVIWIYTHSKKASGEITREQQTPIILEKNAVIGMGRDFYEDYAKRKGVNTE